MLVSIATGAARELADAGDPVLPDAYGYIVGSIAHPNPFWSPDSAAIFYRKDQGARSELWRPSIRDGASRKLSVVFNTDRVTAPLLLNVADREVISGSAEVFSALDRAGRPSRVIPLNMRDGTLCATTSAGSLAMCHRTVQTPR